MKLSVFYYIIRKNIKILITHKPVKSIKLTLRFNELNKSIIGISAKVLTENLRELENDGIVKRKTYAVVPPKVEYSLSTKGKELKPIIDLMKEFGNKYKDKK